MSIKNTCLIKICLFLIILGGCASMMQYGKLETAARKHYNAGNYDNAVAVCAQSLKLKPEYDKAQLLMQESFRLAKDSHLNNIKNQETNISKFKWDGIVNEYNSLISLNQTVNSLPPLTDKKTGQTIKFEISDYSEQLNQAKQKAAESHYLEAVELSKKEGLDIQKHAAKEFKKAESYVPGYKNCAEMYEKCRKAGIKRIAIIPFENKSGKAHYGAISEMITDNIISNIMNDPSAMEFLEIISRDQLETVMREQQLGVSGIIDEKSVVQLGQILGVHEMVSGQITQIIHTPERTTTTELQETEKVVVGQEKYIDNKGKQQTRSVWGDVYAQVKKFKKVAQATINGSYKIVEIKTAKLIKSDSFKGDDYFLSEWAKFSGDEKALSKSTRNLLKAEEFAPAEEAMVNDAANDLSKKLATALKDYAR